MNTAQYNEVLLNERRLNVIWNQNRLNSTNNWGCLMFLYKKYGCPKSHIEFYKAYINDIGTGRDHGRDKSHFYKFADTLGELDNYRLSTDVYKLYIYKKVIIDVVNGSKKEAELKDILESKGFVCKEPTIIEDTKFGIDKFLYKDDKLVGIVQIKPNTFFIGNQKMDLLQDRRRALVFHEVCILKYNVPVVYMIYKKSGGWVMNNGNYAHNLLNLLDTKGNSVKPKEYFT